MRGALGALAAGALLFGGGCADDCETVCGKLQFCELLPGITLRQCVDRCYDREATAGQVTDLCADCLDDASCSTIAAQGCAEPCAPVLAEEPP